MRKNTRAYFGAGVYAECTGFDIVVLTSNGVGNKATDRIYLDPQMIRELFEWQEAGYPDHDGRSRNALVQHEHANPQPDGHHQVGVDDADPN